MRLVQWMAASVLAAFGSAACAGPPYLTDDPEPTEAGHWEIYAFTASEGRGPILDTDEGLDLNYGAIKGVQLSATIPVSISHDPLEGWRGGTGDLELGVKYRFFESKDEHLSAATFPRVILPTGSRVAGEKSRILLPIWIEKYFPDGTSLFGGSGYEINPGVGSRNFWQAALALTHDLNKRVSVGGELAWRQRNTAGQTEQVQAGVGAIYKLSEHYALLFSGGPTWEGRIGYHSYIAIGANL